MSLQISRSVVPTVAPQPTRYSEHCESGDVHKKQLLTYLWLMDNKLGLLINFGENRIKNGISRVINGLDD
jgi:hypothetical protein